MPAPSRSRAWPVRPTWPALGLCLWLGFPVGNGLEEFRRSDPPPENRPRMNAGGNPEEMPAPATACAEVTQPGLAGAAYLILTRLLWVYASFGWGFKLRAGIFQIAKLEGDIGGLRESWYLQVWPRWTVTSTRHCLDSQTKCNNKLRCRHGNSVPTNPHPDQRCEWRVARVRPTCPTGAQRIHASLRAGVGPARRIVPPQAQMQRCLIVHLIICQTRQAPLSLARCRHGNRSRRIPIDQRCEVARIHDYAYVPCNVLI